MNPYHKKAKEIQHYLDALCAPEDDALQEVKKAMAAHQLPPISITPLIGKLLALLANLVNASRILEIGTLGGYSTIWLARALPDTGTLTTLEISPKNGEAAKSALLKANLLSKVEIIIGDALKTVEEMAQRDDPKFDLIFLDADKPHYPDYIEPMIQLCRPGGLVIADNLIRRGKVISPSPTDAQANAIAAFNARIARHPKLESVIIPTLVGYIGGDLDGLSISRVKNLS